MANPNKALLDSSNDITFWEDGLPTKGIRTQSVDNGLMQTWNEGLPTEDQFPRNNKDTGKFFAIFEE